MYIAIQFIFMRRIDKIIVLCPKYGGLLSLGALDYLAAYGGEVKFSNFVRTKSIKTWQNWSTYNKAGVRRLLTEINLN
jgi:hypothetical protein